MHQNTNKIVNDQLETEMFRKNVGNNTTEDIFLSSKQFMDII